MFRNTSYRRFRNQTNYYSILSNPTTLKFTAIFGIGIGAFYYTHLDAAPISGRRRFIFAPKWIELYIGKTTYSQVIAQYRHELLPITHPLRRKISRIMHDIIQASDYKDDEQIKWEINVIQSSTAPPNAFVLPGGKVFVFSSILPIAGNDDGLATVLSHEFAHQLARHSMENLSRAPLYSALSLVLYSLTGSSSISDVLINLILSMPASREMETEADYIGLMLMAKACYDPREAAKVWARFHDYESKVASTTSLPWLSTHPPSQKRFANMQKWLPEAQLQRELGNCDVGNWFSDFKATAHNSTLGIDTTNRSGSNGGLW